MIDWTQAKPDDRWCFVREGGGTVFSERRYSEWHGGLWFERPDSIEMADEGEGMATVKESLPVGALSTQAGGSHYKDMAIQPVEYIRANNLDYLSGNIVKYASRHKRKNGAEDIRKIIHYCELILELEYGERAHG